MKFAKKIFVGIIAVSMLLSTLALSISADTPKLPVENLSDVYEYLSCEKYLVEDYDGYDAGDYAMPVGSSSFGYVNGEATSSVAADSSNKYLLITNNSTKQVGYSMYWSSVQSLVTSFDFRTGDANGNGGSDFFVKATLGDYFQDITLFAVNTSLAGNREFIYSEYNEDRVTYSTVIADVAPELGVWYHVDILFSPDTEEYSVTLKKGADTVFSFADKIDKSETGVDSVRIYVSDSNGAGETKTAFDNVCAYEGTAVRDVFNPDNTLADIIIAIDSYAKDSATSLDKKLDIVDFYSELFSKENDSDEIFYEVPEGIAKRAEVLAVVEGVEAFVNKTSAEALVTYVDEAKAKATYYEKAEHLESYAKEYYDMFASFGDELGTLPGMSSENLNAVKKALEEYEKLSSWISDVEYYSEAFVYAIETGYDALDKNYETMRVTYASLSIMIDRVAPEYKYSEVEPETKYPTVADAIAEYKALEAKIAAISKNASEIFIPAVNAMDNTQVEAVSAEAPFLTKNFDVLYQNYLSARSVYKNGTVHEALDPETYPGLEAAISEYLYFEEYILARIDECNDFIAIVSGASSSNYYQTILEQVEEAGLYLDSNKEKSLEEFEGVSEAISSYLALVEKIEANETGAVAYINAVNQIDINASYAVLKAAVASARQLKGEGFLMGIAGVEDANIKFSAADAKVAALEGNSSTLISAVNALKTAKTLSERRELIFIANNAKDKAEASIDGVAEAKTELNTQIQKYNSDVNRVNALFGDVVSNSSLSISAAASSSDAVSNSAGAFSALIK